MLLTLAWKEYREHRGIWFTMIAMTGLFALAIKQLALSQDPSTMIGLSMLALAAVYGVVCGSMMLAGEREGGTLVLFDIFLGQRWKVWSGKLVLGVILAATEALAVALILYLLKQVPPAWIETPAGQGGADARAWIGARRAAPGPEFWFLVLPLVTLEAYAWGLLGSSMTKRVLTGAGLALLMGFHAWMLTLVFPAPACLIVRAMVAGLVLFGSCALFSNRLRDTPLAPPEAREDLRTVVMRELNREMYTFQGVHEEVIEIREEWELAAPLAAPFLPTEAKPKARSRRQRPRDAKSPQEVLYWLTFQQAGIPLVFLGGFCLFVALFLPDYGELVWPFATLLIGVGCGTATFAWEQSDLSYQFLAAQHFPLRTIWHVRMLFWFTTAAAGALLAALAAAFFALVYHASRQRFGPAAEPFFRFGALLDLLGPVNFFAIWLVYGFCAGQIFVFLCRKTIYALVLSALVSAGAIGVWMPTLLCRGMAGWQLWLPPMAALAATRGLMRVWAGGRIKERRPLAALVGLGAGCLLWASLEFGVRAWEVPAAPDPLDRASFRASIPTGKDNAGPKLQEMFTVFQDPNEKEAAWLGKLAEAARLPVGVIEAPSSEGQEAMLYHLKPAATIVARLRELAQADMKRGDAKAAFDRLTQILALSRTLRNKAPLASYLAGVQAEASAIEGLHLCLASKKPSLDLLENVWTELTRHAQDTPPPLDCLQTECYRSGGLLQNPLGWSYASGQHSLRERWLTDSIALSLEAPWEKERAARLWTLVWAGLFRAVETPAWQLPREPLDIGAGTDETRTILRGWLPEKPGPGASPEAVRISRLLDESWLSDPRLFCPVVPLRNAGNRSRWQMEAARLTVTLAIYQVREGKVAGKLDDLVPKYLPEVPSDPYSGKSFHYRISEGEKLDVQGDEPLQGNAGAARQVAAGQGILWSTGPDGTDDGGKKHGGHVPDDNPLWRQGDFDLVTVVPKW
jgi:hypothetical protein